MKSLNQQSNEFHSHQNGGDTVKVFEANHILTFSNRTVSAEDFVVINQYITSIALDKCASFEWEEVLSTIASLTQVVELNIARCGLRDNHMKLFNKMRYLRSLSFGTTSVMQMRIWLRHIA
jgi:hypothetical protein